MPYESVLELMQLDGMPDGYLLGCHATRVTLLSQQVRAINLINAIQFFQSDLRNTRIAIVGAGAAGITAAAQALEHQAHVTLIDQNAQPLSIQTNASHRWLHPQIYDWPFISAEEAQRAEAGLPFMNWQSGNADEVAEQLQQQWKDLLQKNRLRISPQFNTSVLAVKQQRHGCELTLKRVEAEAPVEQLAFDKVVLAVGFGLEALGRNSYWEKDALDQAIRGKERAILIAGYGDGALTDLMRACFVGFEHRRCLTEFISLLTPDQVEQVKSIEQDPRAGSADFLTEQYEKLDYAAAGQLLMRWRNAAHNVVLTGRGRQFLDTRASALNRLIVSQMHRMRLFKHVPLSGDQSIARAASDDPSVAWIEEQAGIKFDEFVLRFGPESACQKIKGIEQEVAKLRSHWQTISVERDPTRRKLWETVKPRSTPLSSCCALIHGDGPSRMKSKELVDGALAGLKLQSQTELELVEFSVDEFLRSPQSLEYATRVLARAPVTIFSIGIPNETANPGGMLLLGLRAAVRRGLTIVLHVDEEKPINWDEVPFNLRELHILSIPADGAARLGSFIASGLLTMALDRGSYNDLPVFDVVRRPLCRTQLASGNTVEIFALCPFNQAYLKGAWLSLKLRIPTIGAKDKLKLELKRLTDYESPLLVSERLYELTRFAGICLVDWTHWRANVFFELGVRIAVNPSEPLCVIHKGAPVPPESVHGRLISLFSPLVYSTDEDEKTRLAFEAGFRRLLAQIRAPGAKANPIYAAAQRTISIDQEYGATSFESETLQRIEAIIGPDPVELGRLPVLFGSNDQLARQVWRAAVESLFAARLLIDVKLGWAAVDHEAKARLEEIRDRIVGRIEELLEMELVPEYLPRRDALIGAPDGKR